MCYDGNVCVLMGESVCVLGGSVCSEGKVCVLRGTCAF